MEEYQSHFKILVPSVMNDEQLHFFREAIKSDEKMSYAHVFNMVEHGDMIAIWIEIGTSKTIAICEPILNQDRTRDLFVGMLSGTDSLKYFEEVLHCLKILAMKLRCDKVVSWVRPYIYDKAVSRGGHGEIAYYVLEYKV